MEVPERKTNDGSPSEPLPLVQRGLGLLIGGFAEKAGLWRMRGWVRPGDYLGFLRRHPRRLGFCFLWIAASSLGQTFFLSMFQPYWMANLGLSTAFTGGLYGAATLLSASLLGWLGSWVDRTDIRRVAFVTVLGLTLGMVLSAWSPHWLVLFIAVALLRMFGQGLSSMLGTVSAARWFPLDQGKAVSLAGLGYPTGEALLPGLMLFSLGWLGWRSTSLLCAVAVPLLLWPLSMLLVRARPGGPVESATLGTGGKVSQSNQDTASVYRDSRFMLMLVIIAPVPFFATGVIFFQAHLSGELGWGPGAFASGFLLFALVRAAFSLGAGALVDRIGPMCLLGLPLIVLGVGMLILAAPVTWGIYPFFVCMGLAFGISGSVNTSAWSKLFGLERLGEVRGASASATVFATAAAPALFGLLFQFGGATRLILVLSAVVLFVCWPVRHLLKRQERESSSGQRMARSNRPNPK